MEYSDIASVSGKGGLFKVLSTTRGGVILESIDEDKKKFVAGVHQKVSILSEISIYTRSAKGSTPIADVLRAIHKEFGGDPDVDAKSPEELKAFFKHILPDYDEERVYPSDIKKVISWYLLINVEIPELLNSEKGKKGQNNTESDDSSSDQSN